MSTTKSTPKTRTIAEIRRCGETPIIMEVSGGGWLIGRRGATPSSFKAYPVCATPKAAWKAAAEALGV
jgi:hypothetical protein